MRRRKILTKATSDLWCGEFCIFANSAQDTRRARGCGCRCCDPTIETGQSTISAYSNLMYDSKGIVPTLIEACAGQGQCPSPHCLRLQPPSFMESIDTRRSRPGAASYIFV